LVGIKKYVFIFLKRSFGMKKVCGLTIGFVLLVLVGSAVRADIITLTQGVNGYTGQTNAEMSSGAWGTYGYTEAAFLYETAYHSGDQIALNTGYYSAYRQRDLIKFDLAGQLPVGAVITSASLVLTQSKVDYAGGAVKLFNALQPWIQPYTTDGVYWTSYGNGGTDSGYLGALIGSGTDVADGSSHCMYSLDLATVQSWVTNPLSNNGFLVKYDPEQLGVVWEDVVFYSNKASTVDDRPTLLLEYAVPEPSTVGLLGMAGLGLLRRRK
jgi:hypothetical protein